MRRSIKRIAAVLAAAVLFQGITVSYNFAEAEEQVSAEAVQLNGEPQAEAVQLKEEPQAEAAQTEEREPEEKTQPEEQLQAGDAQPAEQKPVESVQAEEQLPEEDAQPAERIPEETAQPEGQATAEDAQPKEQISEQQAPSKEQVSSGDAQPEGQTSTEAGAAPQTEAQEQTECVPETQPEPSGETERTEFALKVRSEAGKLFPIKKISGPRTLTSGNVTHSVDYQEGIYTVCVPEDTETVCLVIEGLAEKEKAELTKWSGYLTEQGDRWLLCPDDPVRDGCSVEENGYFADLEKFRIEPESVTLEQMAVYGGLDADSDYAEIFISASGISSVLLIEFMEEDQETEREPETEIAGSQERETAPGQEDETELAGEDVPRTEAESETEEREAVTETMWDTAEVLEATPQEIRNTYDTSGKFLADMAETYTPQVGSLNGEWQILGLARSGQEVDPSVYSKYKANVISKVQSCNGVLHEKKYTEYSRLVLALTALGEDVTNVGGYNLLQPLSDFDQTVWQGINGAIWALLAFDSHNYEIPAAAQGKTQNSREKLIEHILSKEISGGGWAMSGNTPDPDVTGMALQALAPYCNSNAAVKAAAERGVNVLSSLQNADGGYGSWGVINSESCAQVIVALTALGIDPAKDSRFIKNGNSVVDALTGFSNQDGSFRHIQNGGADQMATEQAYYALTSYYRFAEGKTSLYDMSDVVIQSDRDKAASVENLIQALPSQITSKNKDQVRTAWLLYQGLNSVQKGLISASSAEKLQKAVDKLAELGISMDETESNSGSGTGSSAGSGTGSGTGTTAGSGSGTGSTSSGTKTAGGTTKRVNLVSSSGSRTGGTIASGVVSGSPDKDSANGKTEENTEEETEEETESRTDEKQGGTKAAETVKNLISAINDLFRSAKAEEKLPELAQDYTDTQISAILDIYRTFIGLSEEEQEKVKVSSRYQDYQDVLEKLREENHFDAPTGTDLRDNEEEVLPWYIQLQVKEEPADASCEEKLAQMLENRGELYGLKDIQLTDLLNGGEYEPEDVVRVRIPMEGSGAYENAAVVHIRDDGSMEFLEGHISGSDLEFDTDEFSRFGIIGFDGSLEELMEAMAEEKPDRQLLFCLLPGGGAAFLLLILAVIRAAGSRKKREAFYH